MVIRLTTRWWSAYSVPLFNQVSKTHSHRSVHKITKSILHVWSRVTWCHVYLWRHLCLNTDKLWLASPITELHSHSDLLGRLSQSQTSRSHCQCPCGCWVAPAAEKWSPWMRHFPAPHYTPSVGTLNCHLGHRHKWQSWPMSQPKGTVKQSSCLGKPQQTGS